MTVVALVDNDFIFQFTTTRIIESTKIAQNVIHFENGLEALLFLKNNATHSESLPDILFLDVNMPIVDGWMFLQEFASIKTSLSKTIRIYMVSSSVDPRDIKRAKTFEDVVDFISKPITSERFAELLKSF
jgi:two-component system, chemotaxis family, chemotaxis protein CheY